MVFSQCTPGFQVVATQKYRLVTETDDKQQFIFVWLEAHFHTGQIHLHFLTSFGPASLNCDNKTPDSLYLHWGVTFAAEPGSPWNVPNDFCPTHQHTILHEAVQSRFRATTQFTTGQRGDPRQLTASAVATLCDKRSLVVKTLPGLRPIDFRRLRHNVSSTRDPGGTVATTRCLEDVTTQRAVRYNEVVVPLSLASIESAGYIKFVLYDAALRMWIKPTPETPFILATRYIDAPFEGESRSLAGSVTPGAPLPWTILGTGAETEFCIPLNQLLRYVALHKFRKTVAKMATPPTLYQQSDIDASKINVDVAVWPVSARLTETSDLVLRRNPPQFVIVEIIVNMDTASVLDCENGPRLYWGIISTPTLRLSATDPSASHTFHWEIPNLCNWPPGTSVAARGTGRTGAVETVLQRGDCYGPAFHPLWRTRISYLVTEIPHALVFVLTNANHTWWLKDRTQQDFTVLFPNELRSGTVRHCLVGRSPSVPLFGSPVSGAPASSQVDDYSCTENSTQPDVAQRLIYTGIHPSRSATKLREDPFVAGAAIALKMAQSGQIGTYQSASCHPNGPGQQTGAELHLESLTSGDEDESGTDQIQRGSVPKARIPETPAAIYATPKDHFPEPWVGFAGKRVLVSRSRYQSVYRGNHSETGPFTVEYSAFHNERGSVVLTVACKISVPVITHWGMANKAAVRDSGRWKLPEKELWPSNSRAVSENAVETPFRAGAIPNLWTFEVTLSAFVGPRQETAGRLPFRYHKPRSPIREWQEIQPLPEVTPMNAHNMSVCLDIEADSGSRELSNTDEEETEYGSKFLDDGFDNGIQFIMEHSGRLQQTVQVQPSNMTSLPLITTNNAPPFQAAYSRYGPTFKDTHTARLWSRSCVAWGFLRRTLPHTDLRCTPDDYNGIYFVITTPSHSLWIKSHNNADFYLPARLAPSWLICETSQKRLIETILMAELYYSRWGLKERYSLFRTFLNNSSYDKRDPQFWTWIYVWFGLFSFKIQKSTELKKFPLEVVGTLPQYHEICDLVHGVTITKMERCPLPYQRGEPLLPWEMAEQADELILLLTSYWRNYPQHRMLIRLILKDMMIPPAAARCLSHAQGLMAKWCLQHQPFFRSWLNKMSVSCTPDDLIICTALIRFLETGSLDQFNGCLDVYSLNLKTLCEGHPIEGNPVYPFLPIIPPGFRANGIIFMEVDAKTGQCLRPWRLRRTSANSAVRVNSSDATPEDPVSYSYSQWTLIAQMGTNKHAVSRSDLVQIASPEVPASEHCLPRSNSRVSGTGKNNEACQGNEVSDPHKLPLYIWSDYQERYSQCGAIPVSNVSDDVWIIPFVATAQKNQVIKEFRFFKNLLESIFEGANMHIMSLLSQDAIPAEARKNVNSVLCHPHMRWTDAFFKISRARYALLPILQHCSDNALLRDTLFVDMALDKVQQDLALSLLSLFRSYSPNLCCCSERLPEPTWEPKVSFTPKSNEEKRNDLLQHCGDASNKNIGDIMQQPRVSGDAEMKPLPFPRYLSSCGYPGIREPCAPEEVTSNNVSLSSSSLSLSSLRSDQGNESSTTDLNFSAGNCCGYDVRTNPLYLLKEMLACLVGSLLAFHVEFEEMETIHNDICTLLTQPQTSCTSDHHGCSLDLSTVRLREKLQANATVEQVQFARGFYQTQSQKRIDRHLVISSRSASRRPTPFIIPAVAVDQRSHIASETFNGSMCRGGSPVQNHPPSISLLPLTGSLNNISTSTAKEDNGESAAQIPERQAEVQQCLRRKKNIIGHKVSAPLTTAATVHIADSTAQGKPAAPFGTTRPVVPPKSAEPRSFLKANAGGPDLLKHLKLSSQRKRRFGGDIFSHRLATIDDLRGQTFGDDEVYASLLFMRSVVQRLQRVMDRILLRLSNLLDPKAQQVTVLDERLPNGWTEVQPGARNAFPHLVDMECIEQAVYGRLRSWCQGDLVFLHRILFETPIYPTVHLLDIMSSILDSIFHCTFSRCWRVLNHSIERKTGTLCYTTDLSGTYKEDSIIILDRPLDASSRIPNRVAAVLFPAVATTLPPAETKPCGQRETTMCPFPPLPLSVCSLSYVALDSRRSQTALCCCEDVHLFSLLLEARSLLSNTHVQVELHNSHRSVTLTVFPSKSSMPSDFSTWASSLILALSRMGMLDHVNVASRHPVPHPSSYSVQVPPLVSHNTFQAVPLSHAAAEKEFTWFVDVKDFSLETTGPRSEGFRTLHSYLELGHNLAATIVIPFSAFDRTLEIPENRPAFELLKELIARYERTHDEHLRYQILFDCRNVVQRLRPPIDFQLEYQRVKRVASLCRGTNTAAVIRRAARKPFLHFWRGITTVWSSLYTPSTLYYCVASGLDHSKLRVSVTVQAVRPFDLSFRLHSGINCFGRPSTKIAGRNVAGSICPVMRNSATPGIARPFDDSLQLGSRQPYRRCLSADHLIEHSNYAVPGHSLSFQRLWNSLRYYTHLEDLDRFLLRTAARQKYKSFFRDAVMYGEVFPGLTLQHCEVLASSMRCSFGSPLSFVAPAHCGHSIPMPAGEAFTPDAVLVPWADAGSILGRPSPSSATQDCQTTTSITLPSWNSAEAADPATLYKNGSVRSTRHLCYSSRFCQSPTMVVGSPYHSTMAPTMSTSSTSFPELNGLCYSHVSSSASSVRPRPVSDRSRKHVLLSFPTATSASCSRKSSLLLRGDFNVAGITSELPIGSLIAVSTTVRGSPPPVENCSIPLIYSPQMRNRILDRLVALQDAIHSVTKYSSWRVEGMLSSHGCVTITDFYTFPALEVYQNPQQDTKPVTVNNLRRSRSYEF